MKNKRSSSADGNGGSNAGDRGPLDRTMSCPWASGDPARPDVDSKGTLNGACIKPDRPARPLEAHPGLVGAHPLDALPQLIVPEFVGTMGHITSFTGVH